MTPFVMRRSFAEQMGIAWPADAAMKVGGLRGVRFVTWSEVLDQRRQRQAERLATIREAPEPEVVPCFIWTFFIPGWLYSGWHCYLISRHFEIGVAPEANRELTENLIRAVPMGQRPLFDEFELWMAELANRHPRKHPRDPRRAGSVIGWLEHRRRFTLTRPGRME